VTEFAIAALALDAAASKEVRSRQENLDTLARVADRAMQRVEDTFLAASVEGRGVESDSRPLEEVLEGIGL
jgi:hypothetical protein